MIVTNSPCCAGRQRQVGKYIQPGKNNYMSPIKICVKKVALFTHLETL